MEKVTMAGITRSLEEIYESIRKLEEQNAKLEGMIAKMNIPCKNPKSSRAMTREDAERVVLGDLKSLSTKKAAEQLGLSYGQVYSARGGYTFMEVFEQTLKKS